jgi:hypothetical protein
MRDIDADPSMREYEEDADFPLEGYAGSVFGHPAWEI